MSCSGGDGLHTVTHGAWQALLSGVECGLLGPTTLAARLIGKLEAGRVQALQQQKAHRQHHTHAFVSGGTTSTTKPRLLAAPHNSFTALVPGALGQRSFQVIEGGYTAGRPAPTT